MTMKIYIRKKGGHLLAYSGIAQAIHHQEEALRLNGVETVARPGEGTDAVFINTLLPGSVLAALTAKARGQLVVFFAHSSPLDIRDSFKLSNLLAPLLKRWMAACYKLGDVLITPTPYSKQLLKWLCPAHEAYSLSNGVDTRLFHPSTGMRPVRLHETLGLPPGRKLVISVGHLIERKGILDFIETARRMPGHDFLWFGDTPPILRTGRVRKALGKKPRNLHLMGAVPQSILQDAYREADAFLFLSKEETEGIVVLEALASALPVIIRDIPVYDAWLVNGRDAWKVRSVDEAVETVGDVLAGTLPDTRQEGLVRARERDLGIIGQGLMHIVCAALNQRGTPATLT